MTPLTYDILLALADATLHGYAIIREIETMGGEGSAPSTGAMYLALQRMAANGLIEEAERPSEGADARRRYYRITGEGRRAAEGESLRLARLVEAARRKELLPGSSMGNGA